MNMCTAALVTEPVLVPRSAAFTLAIVAASTSNEVSTSRIDCTCEDESPEACVAGVAGVAGTAGVVAVAGVAGVAGVAAGAADDPDEPPDDPDDDDPLLVLPPVVLPPAEEQSVADGVMTMVAAVVGANVIFD